MGMPSIQSIGERTKKCPICRKKIYEQWDSEAPNWACLRGENTDEGGGTIGFHVICYSKLGKD